MIKENRKFQIIPSDTESVDQLENIKKSSRFDFLIIIKATTGFVEIALKLQEVRN